MRCSAGERTEAELLRSKAELDYARCAVRLQQPDGEKLILDFIRTESLNPIPARRWWK